MNEEELVWFAIVNMNYRKKNTGFYNGGWRKNRKIGKLSGNG